MKKPALNYPFEVLPLSKDEGGGYAITFPDLPGCRSDGETPGKAIENGLLALSDWLAVATEFGDAIPVPFSSLSGRFVQRVPRSLHRQLVDEAKVGRCVAQYTGGLACRRRTWPPTCRSASVDPAVKWKSPSSACGLTPKAADRGLKFQEPLRGMSGIAPGSNLVGRDSSSTSTTTSMSALASATFLRAGAMWPGSRPTRVRTSIS